MNVSKKLTVTGLPCLNTVVIDDNVALIDFITATEWNADDIERLRTSLAALIALMRDERLVTSSAPEKRQEWNVGDPEPVDDDYVIDTDGDTWTYRGNGQWRFEHITTSWEDLVSRYGPLRLAPDDAS